MKKAILASLLGVTCFIGGLIATFYAMPYIAPDLVERVRYEMDSLAMVADGSMDSLLEAQRVQDSLRALEIARPVNDMLAGLRDSLDQVNRALESEQAAKEDLMARIAAIETAWKQLQEKYDEARKLSGTLARLEDKELAELLSRLEPDVIESMYVEASPRNRTRLLQMLPADKAARLVHTLADPGAPFTSDANPDRNPLDQQ